MHIAASHERQMEQAFLEGFYDIPSTERLRKMSLAELLSLSWHSEKDSPRQRAIEIEITRRTSSGSFVQGLVPLLNLGINLIRLIRSWWLGM